MTCLRIALLCLAIVPSSFANDDIHEFMSPEEVQQVFHTDSVPKYEIVKVDFTERLHKRYLRAGSKMCIRAFGHQINLWLHPGKSILAGVDTPVYYSRGASSKPGGVEYWHWKGMMQKVGQILEDPYRLASFVIGKENSGRTRVNGFIASQKMVVRSLPPRVAEEYRRRRRSVGDFDDFKSPYHVVFKTTETYERNYPVLPVNETSRRPRASQFIPKIPNILYPQILVVVEYSMYRLYKHDLYGLLEYLLAFWNGVDLKYRSIKLPSFRFHISCIIFAQDPEATPYISNYRMSDNVFHARSALMEAQTFYYDVKDTFPLNSYDISVTMTKQEFGVKSDASVFGLAIQGGACRYGDSSTDSVSIIRDNGAFSGVSVAAHEVGHLFGAGHDADNGECKYKDGFLMTIIMRYTRNSSDFSSCSIQAIDERLKARKLDCLFNRPRISEKRLPTLMPGKMKNLEEQCRGLDMGAPCQYNASIPDVCVNIYCLNKHGECTNTEEAVSDGTSCGNDDGFCLHMQCVSL